MYQVPSESNNSHTVKASFKRGLKLTFLQCRLPRYFNV